MRRAAEPGRARSRYQFDPTSQNSLALRRVAVPSLDSPSPAMPRPASIKNCITQFADVLQNTE